MADRFLGEIAPIGSRWVWPFAEMEKGDWFIVRHELRDPEKLRQMVAVRQSQLGKHFVTVKEPAELPGFAKVSCEEPKERVIAPKAVSYATMVSVVSDCYGKDASALVWTGLDVGQVFRREWPQIDTPLRSEYLVTIGNDWTFVAQFDEDGVTVERVPQGTTLEIWRKAKIEEVMS